MQSLPRAGTLTAAALLTLTLTACGSSDGSMAGMEHGSSSSSSSGSAGAATAEHDDADVAFARDMIVHHRGALDMAQIATTRASTPEVRDLAARISAAQGPEIDQMSGWLQAWGESVPDDMAGMDHGSAGSMPGMMTDEQMSQLDAATGTDVDRMFLQMMTAHHQGAVDMARTEQQQGSNAAAVDLARSIETSQTAEIAEMDQLLRTLEP